MSALTSIAALRADAAQAAAASAAARTTPAAAPVTAQSAATGAVATTAATTTTATTGAQQAQQGAAETTKTTTTTEKAEAFNAKALDLPDNPTTRDVLTGLTAAMADPTVNQTTAQKLFEFHQQLFEMEKAMTLAIVNRGQ